MRVLHSDFCFQIWTLAVAEGHRLKLTFLDFAVEADEDDGYCYDWVRVRYEGFHEKFCGREIPGPFISKTNTMNVSLYSDDVWNYKGFLAQYEADGPVSNNSEGEGIECFIEL